MTPARILVLDDDHDSADMLAMVLGFHLPEAAVHAFYDGASALRDMSLHHADIIISDLDMPGMNGHQFADAARLAYQHCNRARLIALSGGTGQLATATERRVFDFVLSKPVNLAALLAIVGKGPVLEAQRA